MVCNILPVSSASSFLICIHYSSSLLLLFPLWFSMRQLQWPFETEARHVISLLRTLLFSRFTKDKNIKSLQFLTGPFLMSFSLPLSLSLTSSSPIPLFDPLLTSLLCPENARHVSAQGLLLLPVMIFLWRDVFWPSHLLWSFCLKVSFSLGTSFVILYKLYFLLLYTLLYSFVP